MERASSQAYGTATQLWHQNPVFHNQYNTLMNSKWKTAKSVFRFEALIIEGLVTPLMVIIIMLTSYVWYSRVRVIIISWYLTVSVCTPIASYSFNKYYSCSNSAKVNPSINQHIHQPLLHTHCPDLLYRALVHTITIILRSISSVFPYMSYAFSVLLPPVLYSK